MSHDRRPPEPERYEPMPGVLELPRWLWRKLGRRVRAGLAVLLLAGVAGTVVFAQQRGEENRAREASEERRRADAIERRRRALEAEVRPISRRAPRGAPVSASRAEQIAARRAILGSVEDTIVADARRRVRAGELEGDVDRADCRRFPRTVGDPPPDEDLRARELRLACVAVTAEFGRGAASEGGVIGHPYRVRVDFATGRFTFCKTTGVTGPEREQLVTTPKACGG